jgi:hypothetical protein
MCRGTGGSGPSAVCLKSNLEGANQCPQGTPSCSPFVTASKGYQAAGRFDRGSLRGFRGAGIAGGRAGDASTGEPEAGACRAESARASADSDVESDRRFPYIPNDRRSAGGALLRLFGFPWATEDTEEGLEDYTEIRGGDTEFHGERRVYDDSADCEERVFLDDS